MRSLACLAALVLGLMAYAADDRHALTQAVEAHTNLQLLLDLQPNNSQLLELLNQSRAAQKLVNAYDSQKEQAVVAKMELFRQQAQSFAQGTPVDPAVEQGIGEYHASQAQARAKLLGDVDALAQQVRRELSGDQSRLFDWAAPPEADTGGRTDAVVEEMRDMIGDLDDATRFLERIRYLIASDYSTSRTGRIAEFLRQYYEPNTRDFNDAMQWMYRLTDEVRVVAEDAWPQQAPLYAARVLQRVGALEADQPGERAPYNWWDIYYLLTDAQTPQMLQQIIAARGNVADDAGQQ